MQISGVLFALLAAVLVMVVNVAASFGVVAVYAHLINPGYDESYYRAAAQWIAPWSSVFVGALLFFLAAIVLAILQPMSNAFVLAATAFLTYAMIDVIIMIGSGQLLAMLGIVMLSLATKLAAAMLGAMLAAGQVA